MGHDHTPPTLFCNEALTELEDCIGKETLWPLLTSMPEQCVALLQELETALAAENLADAREIAHNIKGMASSYAAIGIANIARAIEQDDLSVDESKKCATDLKQVLVRTQQWITNAA